MPNLFKRLRLRFGISAPRMAVRTHLAWYWRWLGIMLVASVSLALAAWIYDAGRRFAGYERSQIEQELDSLRETSHKLEGETARLRAIADASESRLKIEQTAQGQLAVQAKALEEENTRLKENLAFFENLVTAGDKMSIHRFTVERYALPGEYRYRLLILQGGKRDRAFQGSLQLVVSVQEGASNVMMVFPRESEEAGTGYKLNFKHFYRAEGSFRVPPAAQVRSVQVRVLESGSSQALATENINLS
jgi:hypothetical protein